MFFIKNIHWVLTSEKDPRWNTGGVIKGVSLGDALALFDQEMQLLRGKFGDPPNDLKYTTLKE